MKTHRCKELLNRNKNDYTKISIYYGYRFGKDKPFTNHDDLGWCLSHLEWDNEWDYKYMNTVCEIKYCPFCGKEL